MAAGHRALDDEPVDPAGGLSRHRGREDVGGDDGEEGGPPQLSRRAGQDANGRQVGMEVVERARALDDQRHRDVLAAAQPIEDCGRFARDPRPHDHEVHAGQHRAVEARQHRDLDLGQQVDADRPVMPLLGEEHLHERRGDRLLDEFGRIFDAVPLGKSRTLTDAVRRREVPGDDTLGNLLIGERREGAANVATLVAGAQAPRHDCLDPRARHDSQLAALRNRSGQHPIGDTRAHASLDDQWSLHRAPPYDPAWARGANDHGAGST